MATGRTREDVVEKLRVLQQEYDDPASLEIDRRITVTEALDNLLARKAKDGAAPKTLAADFYDANLLKAQIGGVKLHELRVRQVRAALEAIAPNATTGHLSKIKGVLSQAIRLVQQDDKMKADTNVAAVAIAPIGGRQPRKRQAFTAKEIQATLKAAIGYRNMDAAVHLGIFLGLRPDEIRGIHWDAVDLTPGQEAVFIIRTPSASGRTKGETASSLGSRRGLGLPQEVVVALWRHKEMQDRDRRLAGAQWRDTGLLIATLNGGQVGQGYFRKAWRAVLSLAGVSTTNEHGQLRVPYEMRHSFASHSTDRGMSHENVAAIMGHKRVATLELVYKDSVKPVIQDTRDVMSGLAG